MAGGEDSVREGIGLLFALDEGDVLGHFGDAVCDSRCHDLVWRRDVVWHPVGHAIGDAVHGGLLGAGCCGALGGGCFGGWGFGCGGHGRALEYSEGL